MYHANVHIMYLTQRILSSGGLFSVESMPGKAAATLLKSWSINKMIKALWFYLIIKKDLKK